MKIEQIVLALILVVAGFLGWQTYQQMVVKKTAVILPVMTSGATGSTAHTASAPLPTPAEALPSHLEYAAEKLRDPFLSYLPQDVKTTPEEQMTVADVPPPVLHLQGLMYGELKPRAIIDGHIVGEGDHFGEVRVIQILRDGVVLTFQNRRFFLKHSLATP